MFQFTGLPALPNSRLEGSSYEGVSPFGHPRIKACLAAPRGLSQLTTSFFGIFCQGIHYTPLNEILFFQRSNSEGKNSLLSICPTARLRILTSNYWIPSRQMADEILITCFEKFFYIGRYTPC